MTFCVFIYMKYIISESNLQNSIDKFLKSSYPEVISVKFRKKTVYLASLDDPRSHERTEIVVVLDPLGITEGVPSNNFRGYVKNKGVELKREIWRTLDNMFALGLEEYGSDWDLSVFIVNLEQI